MPNIPVTVKNKGGSGIDALMVIYISAFDAESYLGGIKRFGTNQSGRFIVTSQRPLDRDDVVGFCFYHPDGKPLAIREPNPRLTIGQDINNMFYLKLERLIDGSYKDIMEIHS